MTSNGSRNDALLSDHEEFRRRVFARAARHLNVSPAEAADMLQRPNKIDQASVDQRLLGQAAGTLALALYRRLTDLLRVIGSGYAIILSEQIEVTYLDIRSKFLMILMDSPLEGAFVSLDENGFPPSVLELGPIGLEAAMEVVIEPAILRNQARLLRVAGENGVDAFNPIADAFMAGYDEIIDSLRIQKRRYEERLSGTSREPRDVPGPVDKIPGDGSFEKQLQEIVSRMFISSDQKPTAESLAKAMNMSRSTLYERFRNSKLNMKRVRRMAEGLPC